MTAARAQALQGFLRKPDPAIAAILIHGEDPGEVHDSAAALVKKVAGSIDDPFNVTNLDEAMLADDGGRIVDEVQSLSFLGGRRAIWVRSAGAAFLRAMEPVLEGRVAGNLVIAESGALARNAALRARFEESPHVLAVALYEASSEEAADLVTRLLKAQGLAIAEDAREKLVELAGTSAPLLERETEKLAIYCRGQYEVGLADIEALCGSSAEITADVLIDAVLGGDVAKADRQFTQMVLAGSDPGQLLSATLLQLQRLADLNIVVARGMRPEQALKSARPPIFFKRHGAMVRQLESWSLNELLAAAKTVAAAVAQARLNSRMARSLAGRTLLAVARSARMQQTRRAR